MARIPGIRRYLRAGRSDASVERQVDDEIAFHFDMCVADLIARGFTPDDAHREATRRFGDVAAIRDRLTRIDRERIHGERRADWFTALGHDARYAARGLRRSPAFTIGVILTLALGIGANGAVFALVDRILLRPAPHIADADQLRRVHVEIDLPTRTFDVRAPMSYPEYVALRDGTRIFDGLAAFNYPAPIALGRGVDAPRVKRSRVTANFFRVLGVRPEAGRFFLPEDDTLTAGPPAAVLSYAFWRRQFAGSADALGQAITLGGRSYVIVGVAPRGFSGVDLDAPDVWVPVGAVGPLEGGPGWAGHKTAFGYHVVARLRQGVSDELAASQASAAIPPAYEGTFLAAGTPRVRFSSIVPGRRLDQRDLGITVATRLVGAAMFVLLIACANVANLLVARTVARRRELAVRIALGVGRARLVGHLLAESLLLAAMAGAAALVVAAWGGGILRTLILPDVSWAYPVVDGRLLAFTAVVSIVMGVAAGLAPALHASDPNLAGMLKSGWRETGSGQSFVRSGLLLVQAAFSVVLLVGAGLFARSLNNARSVDVGFDLDHTMLVDLRLDGKELPTAEWHALFEELADRARRVPGVAGAGIAAEVPYWTISFTKLWVDGRDSLPPDLRVFSNAVDAQFFPTMRARIVAGRGFTAEDRAGAQRVALVNATFARRVWPNESAVGKCLRVAVQTAPCFVVVGVVGDLDVEPLDRTPAGQYYIPLAQSAGMSDFANRYLVVRSADGAGDVRDMALRVRAALRGARSDLAMLSVQPMLELADPAIRPFRLGATMFGVFGLIALVLAGVGVYAVIAFGVARRTRELGIRAALGARVSDVVRLVLGEGLRVTVVGVVLGLAISLALGRVVEALLFDASPRDPGVFAIVALTLLGVAALACALPAWRAGRVDPVVALRDE